MADRAWNIARIASPIIAVTSEVLTPERKSLDLSGYPESGAHAKARSRENLVIQKLAPIALTLLTMGTGSALQAAEGGVQTLSASTIRFSQSSVNGVAEIAESMAAKGWAGAPFDVVQMESGLVTVDNTRLLAAHMTKTSVQAIVHGVGDPLPASMAGRFGSATTWGEAVLYRIGNQNGAYRSLFPGGSRAIGVGKP